WLEPGGVITLERSQIDSNLFIGRLHWSVEGANFIRYMVTAVDASEAGNTVSGRLNTFEITSDVMVDDFERPSRRWDWDGYQRSDQVQAHGSWSLHDRPDNVELNLPREATAEIDEDWNLSIFDRARLRFWEKHEFDTRAGERCVLEIREINSNRWREVMRFTGSQNSWQIRTIELPDYCLGRAEPVRVRFRTHTPRNSENRDGMRIDDFQLLTGNLVDVESEIITTPVNLELSKPFPNPTNSRLSYTYSLPDNGVVELIDITGRIVLTQQLIQGVGTASLEMNRLPTGVYLLKLTSMGSQVSWKVVLLR
ncbi:MAG: T9SS type A sorting domain-containing protein, partial [Calditrichaeota bacterium]|nr:T9SS type A sorting domain-containing protein [Calditrichota bacterium]